MSHFAPHLEHCVVSLSCLAATTYMYKTVHMKRPKIEGMSTICHSLEYIKLGQNDIYNNSVDK